MRNINLNITIKEQTHYFFLKYFIFCIIVFIPYLLLNALYVNDIWRANIKIFYKVHTILVLLTHGFILSFILSFLFYYIIKFFKRKILRIIIFSFLVISTYYITYIDIIIFKLFNFHINGFIIFEAIQPNALHSIGFTNTMKIRIIIEFIALFAVLSLFIYIYSNLDFKIFNKTFDKRFLIKKTVQIILIFIILEKVCMIIASYNRPNYIYRLMKSIPIFYFAPGVYLHHIFKDVIEFTDQKEAYDAVFGNYKECSYPKKYNLLQEYFENRYNIILLLIESTRDKFITNDITPNIYNFKMESFYKKSHFSGSNSTHLSLFSILYSINPYYNIYIKTKKERSFPIQILRDSGYITKFYYSGDLKWHRMDYFIEQNFDYIYNDMQKERYKIETVIIEQIMGDIDNFNNPRPYFIIAFFDSTHYSYSFPEDQAKFFPYLDKYFNKSDFLQKKKLKPKLLNSYYNALNYLDGSLRKLFYKLKVNGSLKNTIVVITSDHGSEFGEDNHFFYCSTLSRFQTSVPLIIHLPIGSTYNKYSDGNIDKISGHMDIFPTIFNIMGYRGSWENFQGDSIFRYNRKNNYTTITFQTNQIPSKYSVIDENYKLIIDTDNFLFVSGMTDIFDNKVTDIPDCSKRIRYLIDELKYFHK